MIIIIVLKPDLEVDPREDLDHESGGSTQMTQIFLKKNNQSNLVLTIFLKQNQWVFDPCFIPG